MNSAATMRHVLLGWLALACADAQRQPGVSARPATEDSPNLGGESSEFGGSSPYCSYLSRTPLDLAGEEGAAWAAAAEGHYDVSFGWQTPFPDVGGFDAATTASLDVRVLGVYDVDFGDYCPGGRYAMHLELDVTVATADGALQANCRHWVGTMPGPRPVGGEPLLTYNSGPYAPFSEGPGPQERCGFEGAIGFDEPPAVVSRGSVVVNLSFEAGTISGRLRPFLSPPAAAARGAGYFPITGYFPDDDCAAIGGESVSIDAPLQGFEEETPRELYERLVEHAQAASFPAQRQVGDATSVRFSIGEPTRVCASPRGSRTQVLIVDVPVHVETGDGALVLDETAGAWFYPNGDAQATISSWPRWQRIEDFEQITGLRGADIAGADFARVELFSLIDLDTGTVHGSLGVSKWQDVDDVAATYPGSLSW
jgi:hypothetical protein